MTHRCTHFVVAEEATRIEADGREVPTIVFLCNWADSAPSQLVDVPRWVQRNAISGHLWRPGDCDGCPCFEEKRCAARL